MNRTLVKGLIVAAALGLGATSFTASADAEFAASGDGLSVWTQLMQAMGIVGSGDATTDGIVGSGTATTDGIVGSGSGGTTTDGIVGSGTATTNGIVGSGGADGGIVGSGDAE